MWTAGTVLVTGANRGIGLEFVKQLCEFETCNKIIACCRDPSSAQDLQDISKKSKKLSIKKLDITDESNINNLAGELMNELPKGLDLLINNAGTFSKIGRSGSIDGIPACIAKESSQNLMETYKVNVIGTFLITRALVPLLRLSSKSRSQQSLIFNITSAMGSIQENETGGAYNYRLSKTAVNMLTKNFSVDLNDLGIICIACHPGWVVTDMGGPNALINTQTSVSRMLTRIMEITPSDNGKLIRFDGADIKY